VQQRKSIIGIGGVGLVVEVALVGVDRVEEVAVKGEGFF
jgi:hypothetical protein